MRKERVFLVLSLILILGVIILLDHTKPITEGKITKITYKEKSTSIFLANYSNEIILQNKSPINLAKGKEIIIFGKQEKSLDKKIIFVDKIICTNC